MATVAEFPRLVREWHKTKNGAVRPRDVLARLGSESLVEMSGGPRPRVGGGRGQPYESRRGMPLLLRAPRLCCELPGHGCAASRPTSVASGASNTTSLREAEPHPRYERHRVRGLSKSDRADTGSEHRVRHLRARGRHLRPQGEASPSTGKTSSSTGEAPPSAGEAPPSAGEASPTTGETSPSTGETSPSTGSACRSILCVERFVGAASGCSLGGRPPTKRGGTKPGAANEA